MRKRRVLALFLALSMALSSNGFTALGAENSSLTITADSLEETDNIGNSAADESEMSDDNGASEEGGDTDNAVPGGNGEDGTAGDTTGGDVDNGSENEAPDGNGENGSEVPGGSDEGNVSDGSDTAGTDEGNNGDESSDNADASENEGSISDETDAVENEDNSDTAEAAEPESALEEDVLAEGEVKESMVDGVRMCSFTDETGMVVTYDANAAAGYDYVIEEKTFGDVTKKVLTGVTTLNDKGETVSLSGVVELKQTSPDDKDYYEVIGASTDVFQGNTDIEYIILPDNVTTIEAGAFSGCTKLRGIKLPSNSEFTEIKANTFEGCTSLTQLSIPKRVTSIGDSAFKGDTSLFMVYIKDYAYSSMKSIGASAFENCRKLEKFGSDKEFAFPGYLESIGDSAFKDCRAIKKIAMPESLVDKAAVTDQNTGAVITAAQEALGTYAFSNCVGLTDVVLSGAAHIPEHAFDGCTHLLSVKLANGNAIIDEYAFANCSVLGEILIPSTVREVRDYAFDGCSQLRYIEVESTDISIGQTRAFPIDHKVWLRGVITCSGLKACKELYPNIEFIANNVDVNGYFKYEYHCLSTLQKTVTFSCSDMSTDPNAANGGKGVKVGEQVYVSVVNSSSVKLTEGSLRCNGTPIGKNSDGFYVFKMPIGGAYVTAEFESTGKDENKNILGKEEDIKYELSNGIKTEADKYTLKIGETSTLFLVDTSAEADNSVIETYKIQFRTNNSKIVSITDEGVIRALSAGTAYITATVNDRTGKAVGIGITIKVEDAEVNDLILKPISYDTSIIEEDTIGETPAVVLRKGDVTNKAVTFTLLASAYAGDDNVSVPLKWSTSDSKVAKLAKTNTKNTESQNVITVPTGASGDATITVTATNTNPSVPENKSIVRKFIVRVKDSTPKLSSSTLLLNPYQEGGVALEIICSGNINSDNVKLCKYNETSQPSSDFEMRYVEAGGEDNDDDSIAKFNIIARNPDLADGAYKATVLAEVGNSEYPLDLNIKVKRSMPNPTVKFAKNQKKINLFYQADGTEVVPVISNLGTAEIEEYRLENLAKSGDDANFTENFEIDEDGIITRTDIPMYYTAKNKPVVTGYLVLKFKGYREGVNEKKYKITIPTNTTKPSYKLERTSDTFNPITGIQDVTLALLDAKTKVPIPLDGEWSVEMDSSSTSSAVSSKTVYVDDDKIHMTVNPRGSGGKVVLAIHNDTWDEGQVLKYKYTVKISDKKTSFKLSKSSVKLNRFFAGTQKEALILKSNQYGVEPENTEFERPNKLTSDKDAQYDKINIEWDAENSAVVVSLDDPDIKNGSYKFTCMPLGENGNKVTLTVKVSGTQPSVSLKGSATLNSSAGEAVDTAELAISVKNLPGDCELEPEETQSSIECITNKESEEGIEDSFIWSIEDNKLKISLKDTEIASKTYNFRMTPSYTGYSIGERDKAKQVKFKVKVYRKSISVSLKAKGKLNLLERFDETDAGEYMPVATAAVADVSTMTDYSMTDISGVGASDDVGSFYPLYAEEGDGTTESGETDTNKPETTPTEPDLTGNNEIQLSYEYNGDEVELKIKAGVADLKDVSPSEDNVITGSDNIPTEVYEFQAIAKTGYEIVSIKAYNTDDKGTEAGNEWSDVTPIVEGNIDNDTKNGILTIGTEEVLADESGNAIGGITIVVEAQSSQSPDTPYSVTISKPAVGISDIEYAVIDDGTDVDKNTSYTSYVNSFDIKDTQKLAIKVIPDTGYGNVSLVANEGETDETELVAVDGLDNVYLLNSVTADTTISVKAEYTDGKTVTYVRNGEHFEVKKSATDDGEITGEDKTTADGYTFVVVKNDGYDVEVKAYLSTEYGDGKDLDTKTDIIASSTPSDSDSNTITCVINEADITEGITIVLTESCSVTIDNKTDTTIKKIEYKVGNGNADNGDTAGGDGGNVGAGDADATDPDGYVEYKTPVSVVYGESLSIRITTANTIGESDKVVVTVDDGNGEKPYNAEQTPDNGNVYTCDIGIVKANMTINVSVETPYVITIPETLQNGIDNVEYLVLNSSDEINEDALSSFSPCTNNKIDVVDGKKLALRFTMSSDNYKIDSVKCNFGEASGLPDSGDVSGSGVELSNPLDNVYVLENITGNGTISVDVKEVRIITFKKNGNHAKVKGADSSILADNGKDSVAKNSSYTFTVEPNTGYDVDVKAYTTESYNKNEDATLIEVDVTKPSDNSNTYTIAADAIEGDITIVVTDIYTFTIENESNGAVTGLQYKTADMNSFVDYNEGAKPTVMHGENISFKFTPPSDKNIILLGKDGEKLIKDADSSSTEPVYTIKKLEDNCTVTISVAYTITEKITKGSKDNDTASIKYGSNVISTSSIHEIPAGKDLTFGVKPNKGYKITNVKYQRGSATDEFDATYTGEMAADGTTPEADTEGYFQYKVVETDITDNIKILVTTESEDKDNYIVEFNVDGASVNVKVGDGEATANPTSINIPRAAEGDARKFTFTVTPNSDYKLRYVGTDEKLNDTGSEITGPDSNGTYTFTLPKDAEPVTTVYVKAETKNINIKVTFADLTVDTVKRADVKTVTFIDDAKITTKPVSDAGVAADTYQEDGKAYFMVTPAEGYTLSRVTMDGKPVASNKHNVIVDNESEAREVTIYELDLTDIYTNVTVNVTLTSDSQGGDEPGDDEPQNKYTLKNSIVYTPVVKNLKDTVMEAKIYDAVSQPSYNDPTSEYFNIDVVDGLLYVTPKEDWDEENGLKNNTTYPVKIWLRFTRYESGLEEDDNGVWVPQTIKIKTAQVLPKVTTDVNTLNLYQANTNYTASFVVRTKEGSIGEIEGIAFDEKDKKVEDSLILGYTKQKDGSLKVMVKLKEGSLYAGNSSNKVKMYVKFKNQAVNTAGTAITLTVKVNK